MNGCKTQGLRGMLSKTEFSGGKVDRKKAQRSSSRPEEGLARKSRNQWLSHYGRVVLLEMPEQGERWRMRAEHLQFTTHGWA